MRWQCVVCLSAVLIAVGAQEPAHDVITGPERTDASVTDDTDSDTEIIASEPTPTDDITMTESTNSDEANDSQNTSTADSSVTPENSENETTNPDEDGNTSNEYTEGKSEQESAETESGTTTVAAKSDENKSDVFPESTENVSGESTAPDPETDVPQSAEAVSAEVTGSIVETEGGPVQGYYLNGDSDLGIRSYYDIPYGTFSYFQPPQKHLKWNEVREITQHQVRCPQIDETGEMAGEVDCLTLSVFAPKNIQNAGVLFHIHDGSFQSGSADPSIYGPKHLVSRGIIVVLPNYRLNALGFYCARDSTAPGNAGLKDLTLALEWTKNNIALFGGDPSKIVASGDGTAGALAGYLAISPMSKHYVSRVIAESGSVLAHWAIDRNPGVSAAKFKQSLKAEILEDVPMNEIVQTTKNITFRPCVEVGQDAFMDKVPWKILQEHNINKTFMVGAANHAGLHEAMQHTEETLSELNQEFSRILPNDLDFKQDDNKKAEITETVKQKYFGNGTVSLQNTEELSLCYTDSYYMGPSIRSARLLAGAGAKVYFYEFSFVGDFNREHDSLITTVRGAARGDIVGYVFVQDDDEPQEDSEEAKMLDLITDLWVTFVQTGAPTASRVEWRKLENVDETEETYLLIENEPTPKKGLHLDRLSLWTKIYTDHFIDRNSASQFTTSLYIVFIKLLLQFHFWVISM